MEEPKCKVCGETHDLYEVDVSNGVVFMVDDDEHVEYHQISLCNKHYEEFTKTYYED